MISKNEFLKIVIPKALTLLEERKNSGALESEADFLAGAMFVLTIVNMEFYEATYNKSMDIVPPMWVLGPMSGRSVLEEAKDES
tara:strand:+ start:408 stop:659 length:252 start_codon:yes stop_codon:yes gene_type:complete